MKANKAIQSLKVSCPTDCKNIKSIGTEQLSIAIRTLRTNGIPFFLKIGNITENNNKNDRKKGNISSKEGTL